MRDITLSRNPVTGFPTATIIAGRRLSWRQWMRLPAFRRQRFYYPEKPGKILGSG